MRPINDLLGSKTVCGNLDVKLQHPISSPLLKFLSVNWLCYCSIIFLWQFLLTVPHTGQTSYFAHLKEICCILALGRLHFEDDSGKAKHIGISLKEKKYLKILLGKKYLGHIKSSTEHMSLISF